MSDKRIIFISRDKTVLRWFITSEGTVVSSGDGQEIDTLHAQPELATDVVLVGDDVVIRTVEIPGNNNKQRLKAAPFAMEEHVASDIEDMHFSYRVNKDSQGIQVAAIEHTQFADYLQALDDLGIEPDRVIPMPALLDTPADCVSLMQVDDFLLINSGTSQWVTDRDSAQIQLALLEQDEQPLLYWAEDEPPAWLLGRSFEVQAETMLEPWHSLIMRLENRTINLLTGRYAKKTELFQLSGRWRRTLQFAASLLVVHLVYMAVELTYLSNARDGMRDEVTSLYQEVMPGARVVDARRQMQQLVQQRQGSSLSSGSFSLMIQSLSETLAGYNDVQPTNLNYSAQNSELRVDLLAGNLSQFDTLKQSLEAVGYEVTMGGASAQGEMYSGRIVMRSAQ